MLKTYSQLHPCFTRVLGAADARVKEAPRVPSVSQAVIKSVLSIDSHTCQQCSFY